ncbi:MAG: T9SS type A sorting domain-containing protein [Bacteroidia bacterium]|nr:T9SS type A sorting domain-containing protein [Bacteroidia bacterium]
MNYMRPGLLISFFALLCSCLTFGHLGAQNLVINSSFEQYTSLPNGIGQWNKIVGWTSPNAGTPDYNHALSPGSAGVPSNLWGNQAALTGQAYISLARNSAGSYYEYIMTHLAQPLVPGNSYYCEMWLSSVDNYYGMGMNNMGFYFSTTPVAVAGNTLISAPAQVASATPIMNTTGWSQVSGTFVATNSAEYLLIGNFSSNAATTWSWYNSSAIATAMYYVENVVVQPTTILPLDLPAFEATPEAEQFARLSWTSENERNTDKFVVERSQDGEIFVSLGEVAAAGNSQSSLDYSFLDKPGIFGEPLHYRLREVDLDGAVHFSEVRTLTLELPQGTRVVSTYPNPVNAGGKLFMDITHDGSTEKGKAEIYDLTGRLLLKSNQTLKRGMNQFEVPLDGLASGTYLLVLSSHSGRISAQKFTVQ